VFEVYTRCIRGGIISEFPRGYLRSEWSRVVKGGTKWRAKRPLTSLWNELDCGAEGRNIEKQKALTRWRRRSSGCIYFFCYSCLRNLSPEKIRRGLAKLRLYLNLRGVTLIRRIGCYAHTVSNTAD